MNKLPEEKRGNVETGVGSNDELLGALDRSCKDSPCVDTLTVNAHGFGPSSCQLGADKFGPGRLTQEQLKRLKNRVCKSGTIIMATCQNGLPEDEVADALQDFADETGRRVCICPGGSFHQKALVCRDEDTGEVVKMICRDPK